MKLTSTFKLQKQTKRTAATYTNSHERGKYIRQMIEAQVGEEEARRQPLGRKDKE